MRINTNVSALNAYRNLSETNNAVSSSMQKLSSGFRINRAADDAAGLGIANKLRGDIRSMTQASRNGEQANSLLQIAEGATGSVQKMLERMKELATQAASDTVDDAGRTRLQSEFDALVDEIDRTVNTTKFQGTKLLDGTSPSFKFMVSSSNEYGTNDTVSLSLGNLSSSALGGTGATLDTLKTTATGGSAADAVAVQDTGSSGLPTLAGTASADAVIQMRYTTADEFEYNTGGGWTAVDVGGGETSFTHNGVTVTVPGSPADGDEWTITLTAAVPAGETGGLLSVADAEGTLASIDEAIGSVAEVMGDIGASQNRIEFAQQNIKTAIQNFSAAESVIRDVDMAEEMTKFSKNNILAQAGTAMLAQANQSAQGVLQLLRG